MNVVFVKFSGSSKEYIFAIPKGYKIHCGDLVIVPDKVTNRHDTYAVALCDSANLPESMIDVIMGHFGRCSKDIVYALGKCVRQPQEIRFNTNNR